MSVRIAIAILLINFVFISCVTQEAIQAESEAELPTIYEKYEDRFRKISIGMQYEDFKIIFPETYLVGQSDEYQAYEFKDTQIYYTSHDKQIGVLWTGSIKTHEYTQKIWFYFKKKRLVKWGEPENWPIIAE